MKAADDPPEPQRLDTLPPEILEAVFDHLSPPDLATVLRVSTTLLTIAYPLLYRHLTLSDAHTVSLSPLTLPRLASLVLPPLHYVHTVHAATHDPSRCQEVLNSISPPERGMPTEGGPVTDELAESLRPLSLSDALSATSHPVPFSSPSPPTSQPAAASQGPPTPPPRSSSPNASPTANLTIPPPPTTAAPTPRLLSLPGTPHPNIREICPLLALRPRTLVLRHAPLLYTRACYALHALRVPRAILAFSPDSAVVGTNFKYEVAPDGPNGFLRRFPNADVVVWVWAVRAGEVWRPSPRPRNAEVRREGWGHKAVGRREGQEEGGGGGGEGEGGEGGQGEGEEAAEEGYVASTWVGRILSPSVFGALKRRCPAVREVVLVNLDALDPVAVVPDEPHTQERVGRVARRWVRAQVGRMGWTYGKESRREGEEGQGRGDAVRVRCLSLREFVVEETEKGASGVGRGEMETWFEGEH